jgi:hypothetical protein
MGAVGAGEGAGAGAASGSVASEASPGSTAWTDEKLSRLDAFVGRWHVEGRQIAGPFGPDAPVSADESYEWLAGHSFLVHHFDGMIDDNDAACVEIIGPKGGRGELAAHTFYNNGVQHLWDLSEKGGVWTMSGTWNHDGTDYEVRCTIRPDAEVRTHLWEYRKDSATPWRTFLDVKARPV